eukprot:SAG22_NODE_98_length_20720_cov_17.226662_4_plen_210_part_00
MRGAAMHARALKTACMHDGAAAAIGRRVGWGGRTMATTSEYYPDDLSSWPVSIVASLPFPQLQELEGLHTRPGTDTGLAQWQAEVNEDLRQAGVATVFAKTRSIVCLDNQSGSGGGGDVNNPTYPTHALIVASFVVFALCDAEAERLRRDSYIGPMTVNLSSIRTLPSSPELPAGTPGGKTLLGPGRVSVLPLSADAVLFSDTKVSSCL